MASTDENEPAKLTEEMRSEITEEEPINNTVKPVDTVSSEDVQTEYEETKPDVEPEETAYFETAKVEELKPALEKIRKSKRKRPDLVGSDSRSLSKLHGELRKHSAAREKTDLAVKDIEKQLKALLLAHHSAIKDLQKQVNSMQKKMTSIHPSRSTRSNTKVKKMPSTRKLEGKSNQKKSRKC